MNKEQQDAVNKVLQWSAQQEGSESKALDENVPVYVEQQTSAAQPGSVLNAPTTTWTKYANQKEAFSNALPEFAYSAGGLNTPPQLIGGKDAYSASFDQNTNKITFNVPESIASTPQWKSFQNDASKLLVGKTYDQASTIVKGDEFNKAWQATINNAGQVVDQQRVASTQAGQDFTPDDVAIIDQTAGLGSGAASDSNGVYTKLRDGAAGWRRNKDGQMETFDASKGLTGNDIMSVVPGFLLNQKEYKSGINWTSFPKLAVGGDVEGTREDVYKDIKSTLERNKDKSIFEWSQDDKNELYGAIGSALGQLQHMSNNGIALSDENRQSMAALMGYYTFLSDGGFGVQSARRQTGIALNEMIINPLKNIFLSIPQSAAQSAVALRAGIEGLGDTSTDPLSGAASKAWAEFWDPNNASQYFSVAPEYTLGAYMTTNQEALNAYRGAGMFFGGAAGILTPAAFSKLGNINQVSRAATALNTTRNSSALARVAAVTRAGLGSAARVGTGLTVGTGGVLAGQVMSPVRSFARNTLTYFMPKTGIVLSGQAQDVLGKMVDEFSDITADDVQNTRDFLNRYRAMNVADPVELNKVGATNSFEDIINNAGQTMKDGSTVTESTVADAGRAMDANNKSIRQAFEGLAGDINERAENAARNQAQADLYNTTGRNSMLNDIDEAAARADKQLPKTSGGSRIVGDMEATRISAEQAIHDTIDTTSERVKQIKQAVSDAVSNGLDAIDNHAVRLAQDELYNFYGKNNILRQLDEVATGAGQETLRETHGTWRQIFADMGRIYASGVANIVKQTPATIREVFRRGWESIDMATANRLLSAAAKAQAKGRVTGVWRDLLIALSDASGKPEMSSQARMLLAEQVRGGIVKQVAMNSLQAMMKQLPLNIVTAFGQASGQMNAMRQQGEEPDDQDYWDAVMKNLAIGVAMTASPAALKTGDAFLNWATKGEWHNIRLRAERAVNIPFDAALKKWQSLETVQKAVKRGNQETQMRKQIVTMARRGWLNAAAEAKAKGKDWVYDPTARAQYDNYRHSIVVTSYANTGNILNNVREGMGFDNAARSYVNVAQDLNMMGFSSKVKKGSRDTQQTLADFMAVQSQIDRNYKMGDEGLEFIGKGKEDADIFKKRDDLLEALDQIVLDNGGNLDNFHKHLYGDSLEATKTGPMADPNDISLRGRLRQSYEARANLMVQHGLANDQALQMLRGDDRFMGSYIRIAYYQGKAISDIANDVKQYFYRDTTVPKTDQIIQNIKSEIGGKDGTAADPMETLIKSAADLTAVINKNEMNRVLIKANEFLYDEDALSHIYDESEQLKREKVIKDYDTFVKEDVAKAADDSIKNRTEPIKNGRFTETTFDATVRGLHDDLTNTEYVQQQAAYMGVPPEDVARSLLADQKDRILAVTRNRFTNLGGKQFAQAATSRMDKTLSDFISGAGDVKRDVRLSTEAKANNQATAAAVHSMNDESLKSLMDNPGISPLQKFAIQNEINSRSAAAGEQAKVMKRFTESYNGDPGQYVKELTNSVIASNKVTQTVGAEDKGQTSIFDIQRQNSTPWFNDFERDNGRAPTADDVADQVAHELDGTAPRQLITAADIKAYDDVKARMAENATVSDEWIDDNRKKLHFGKGVSDSQARQVLQFVPADGRDIMMGKEAPSAAEVKSAVALTGQTGRYKLTSDVANAIKARSRHMTASEQARWLNSPLAPAAICDGKGTFYNYLNAAHRKAYESNLTRNVKNIVELNGGKFAIDPNLKGQDKIAKLEQMYRRGLFEREITLNTGYNRRGLEAPAVKQDGHKTLAAQPVTEPIMVVAQSKDGAPLNEFNKYKDGTYNTLDQNNNNIPDNADVFVGAANVLRADDDRGIAALVANMKKNYANVPEFKTELDTFSSRLQDGRMGPDTLKDLPLIQEALSTSYGVDGVRYPSDTGDQIVLLNNKDAQSGGWWSEKKKMGDISAQDLHDYSANTKVWEENVVNQRNDVVAQYRDMDKALKKPGQAKVTVFENGRRQVYKVDNPYLAAIIKNTSVSTPPAALKMAGRTLRNIGKFFRAGTTGFVNPSYIAVNFVRDAWTAGITGGSNAFASRFTENAFKGMFDDDNMAELMWKKYGTENSSFQKAESEQLLSQTEPTRRKVLNRELRRVNGDMPNLVRSFTSLEDAKKFFDTAGDAVENNRRKQIFVNNYNQALANYQADYLSGRISQDQWHQRALDEAIFMSRNATTDFSNQSKYLNNFISTIPYMRTTISASSSFARVWMHDPIGVTARIFAMGVGPYLAILASTLSDPDKAAVYEQIPEYERRSSLPLVNSDGSYMSISLPQEIIPFLSPFRALMENNHGIENSGPIMSMIGDLSNFSPVDFSGFFERNPLGDFDASKGFMRMLSSITPGGLSSIAEGILNKNFYTGSALYPTTQDLTRQGINKPQPSDYGFMKSPTLDIMSNVMHVNKGALQNGIQRWFGNGGLDLLRMFDATISGNISAVPDTVISRGANRFFNTSPTAATYAWREGISDLYDQRDQVMDVMSSNKYTDEEKKKAQDEYIQSVATFCNTYNQYFNLSGGMTDYQRLQTVNLLNFSNRNIATTDYGNMMLDEAGQEEYAQAQKRAMDLGLLPPEGTASSLTGRYKTDQTTGEQYIDYSTPAMKALQSKVYGTPKQAQADFVKALDRTDDQPSLKALKRQANEQLQPFYDRMDKGEKLTDDDYKAMDQIRQNYMNIFYQRIDPVVNKYGASILNNSDIVEKLNDYTMISSEDWRKSIDLYSKRGKQYNKYIKSSLFPNATADVKQILLEHYGIGGRDTSNLNTDAQAQDLINALQEASKKGEVGKARSYQNTLFRNIQRGTMFVSDQDMKRIPAYY